jgi:hypothetical protein
VTAMGRFPHALVPLLAVASACGEGDPPALRVGELTFGAEVRTEVPAEGVGALADVAAWGLAVRDRRHDSVLAPLAARARERSRLHSLPSLLAARASGLGEDELREAYDQAPQWELEVRHIVRLVDDDAPMAQRLAALEVAEGVLRRAREGEDFGALAAELSEEPGAGQRGGLLEPGREGSWVAPFWGAAVALRPGELSDVVETEYGFHVLRLDARRAVPFAEADRAALLRRLIGEADAAAAMSEWAATAPAPALDSAALQTAREGLISGELAGAVILAAGHHGAAYRGEDLAAGWAAAGPDQRRALRQATPAAFRSWVEEDAREHLWAAEAARLGAPADPGALTAELALWRASSAEWTATFGFRPGIPLEALRTAAIVGATNTGQEFRIARQELEGLRPLLRAAYPLEDSSAAGTSSSSSEIRNRVSTG